MGETPRTIRSIEIFPVGIPMIRGFQFASGSAGKAGGKAPHVFVKITDSEGESGWGDGRPVPQWSYETLETVATTIEKYLAPVLLGLEIWDRQGAQERMFHAIGRGPSIGQPIAKAAVDLALHDLCARVAGLPLRSFLGGRRESSEVPLSWTITAHDTDGVLADMAEGRDLGIQHFNFKAAVSPETDVEIAQVLVEESAAESFIWADANQGYSLPGAVKAARHFREIGVDVLEQPLPADQFFLFNQLRGKTDLPLAVDEASVSPADFFHHARSGLVDYLVVKPTRSGGIFPTLQQMAVAASAGLKILVSGLTDSLLTKMASCQLAAGFGVNTPAALNGSQFIDESEIFPEKPEIEYGGFVHLGNRIGIGTHPDEAVLRKLRNL